MAEACPGWSALESKEQSLSELLRMRRRPSKLNNEVMSAIISPLSTYYVLSAGRIHVLFVDYLKSAEENNLTARETDWRRRDELSASSESEESQANENQNEIPHSTS
jgi:hypothetical protein